MTSCVTLRAYSEQFLRSLVESEKFSLKNTMISFLLNFFIWTLLNAFANNVRLSGKLRTSEEGADTIVWLALQPKEKLVSGAFYFDREQAPKHLAFAGTASSHSLIGEIADRLRSLCHLSS